jgi:hypothetical protein
MQSEQYRLEALVRVRTDIESFVERLIRVLDALDSETEDLEDSDEDDDQINEPSLGATEELDQRKAWLACDLYTPDLECDHSMVWPL